MSAISLQRVGFGMVLLVAFSAGLAVVLVAIGLAVVSGKRWLPVEGFGESVWTRRVPVVSAGVIVLVGVWMTWMALG